MDANSLFFFLSVVTIELVVYKALSLACKDLVNFL